MQASIRQASESYLIALAILLEASKAVAVEPSSREKGKEFFDIVAFAHALSFQSVNLTTTFQRIPSHTLLLPRAT
jgi:hypothetical protein